MGISGGGSRSVLQVLWCISPMPTSVSSLVWWFSKGWFVLVSVLGIFSVPGPIIHSKMIFISTLVTILAPHWAFSRWVWCTAFDTCLTQTTLGSMAVTFLELEGFDFIYVFCCVHLHHWTCVSWSLLPSSHTGEGLYMWLPLIFSLTLPTSLPQSILWHGKVVLSNILFSHSWCCTGISLWDPWCVPLAHQWFCVLPVWCCCISHWCGSSRRLILLECQQ